MKKPALISMLILLMLMSFATTSVFAQEQTAEEEVTEVDDSAEMDESEAAEGEDGEAEDSDTEGSESADSEDEASEEEDELIDTVELVYVEYPCVEADGTLIGIPLGEASDEDMDDVDSEESDSEDADDEDAEGEDTDADESDEAEEANVAFGRFNLVSRQEEAVEVDDAEVTTTEAEDGDTAEGEEAEDAEDAEGEDVEGEDAEEAEHPDCEFIEKEEPEPEPAPAPIVYKDPEPKVNPWYGSYWNNPEFKGGASLVRTDDFVRFNWGNQSPYTRTMGADYNSIRWTHNLRGQAAGFYEVRISSDYGARVDVNGARIVDAVRYGNASPFNAYYFIEGDMEGGRTANIKFDYYHHTGPSVASIAVTPMGEWAAPFGYATVVAGSPVLRDGPGTSYWSNGQIQAGERVKLAGHRNAASNWIYVINSSGVDGWLNAYYLSTSTPIKNLIVWPFTPDGVTGAEPSGNASRDFPYINLRYSPTSDSDVISQVPPGQRVILIGRNSTNTQLLVRMWDGTLGWASRGGIDTGYNINALDIRWVNSAETTE